MALTLAGTPAINGLALPTDTFVSGMVLVASQTFSAAGSVSINNCFTSTYQNYVVHFSYNLSTAIAWQVLRLRTSGSDLSAASYGQAVVQATPSAITLVQANSQTSWANLYLAGNRGTTATITFANPQTTDYTNVTVKGFAGSTDASGVNSVIGGGYYGATTSADGFTLSTGTSFTGTVRVYGLRNA